MRSCALTWAEEPAQGNVNPREIVGFLYFGFISDELAVPAHGLAPCVPVRWEEQRGARARDWEKQVLLFGCQHGTTGELCWPNWRENKEITGEVPGFVTFEGSCFAGQWRVVATNVQTAVVRGREALLFFYIWVISSQCLYNAPQWSCKLSLYDIAFNVLFLGRWCAWDPVLLWSQWNFCFIELVFLNRFPLFLFWCIILCRSTLFSASTMELMCYF